MKRRVLAALLVAVPAAVALAVTPTYFQGFEVDTFGWFPLEASSVTRVPSGDASVSYNSGTTSVYADGVSAATGSWFARVTSEVSSGNCELVTAGGGPTLQCTGPYTYWGPTPPPPKAFPDGGYATRLSIYLDTAYASHHPDCGQQGPCTPDTPGTLNPDCATDPSGLGCEGSRFDWAIGVLRPTGQFLQDYAFNFATGPDPFGNIPGCDPGWFVLPNTNTMRSGTNPYDPGFDAKCIAQSGWYTFEQVFRDDSGFLAVDFTVYDANGAVAACTDVNGDPSTCAWTLHPGHPISEVGCPRYGWLVNEEVNDLPIDDTYLFGSCGRNQPTIATSLSTGQAIVGDGVTDSATLDGATADASGTVTYTVYTDSTCSTPADVGTGAVLGNAGVVDVVDRSVPDSDEVFFDAPGTYHWQATYSGDAKNAGATSECAAEPLQVAPGGQIAPTGTTCAQFETGEVAPVEELTYTTKSGRINAVSPGVFFYYTHVSGDAGDSVSIEESHTGTASPIPILNGQVVLYTDDCRKAQWRSLTIDPDGTATGVLRTAGDYIVGVKYNPSALKNKPVPVPSTVTYTFGTDLDGTPIAGDDASLILRPR